MSQTKAAIYTRISDVKEHAGVGIARQEKLCRELAKNKGYTNIVVYEDDDRSAWTGKPRPGWKAMLEAIEAKEVQAVIAYEPSRLYRHPRDLEPFMALVDKLPIDIATVVAGMVDLSTPQGRAVTRTIVAWDSYESDIKSTRVKAQRDEAASNGDWQSKPRYGYTLQDGQLAIDPEEAEIVRRIVSELRAGRSYRAIAIGLNDDGVPPPSGTGKWGSRKVSATLTPTIAGLYVHRGQTVGKGNWEPIVPRSQYEAALVIAEARKKSGKDKGQPAKHLLTGFLKCGHCGASLYYQKRGPDSYAYKCNKQPESGCGRLSISAEIDDRLAGILTLFGYMLEPGREIPAESGTESPESLMDQIEDIEARMDQLATDYYTDNLIGEREYRAARQGQEAKVAELREKLGTIPTAKPQFESIDWQGDWDKWSVDERRELVGRYIESIVVSPGKKGAREIDMSRLSIEWVD